MKEKPLQNYPPLKRPVRTIPQKSEEKRERISVWVGASMIIVALCVDVAQALLIILGIGLALGSIITIVAYFVFWIWFMILGVSFITNPKKLLTVGIGGAVEALPLFNFLPAFTAMIATVVFMTKAEDKGGMIGKAASLAQGKIKS